MKKILYTLLLITVLCLGLALASSAATYYVDASGNIQNGENEDTAYQYTIADNADNLIYVYVYDVNETKLIIPDMPSYTRSMRPGTWQSYMGVYHISDTARENSLHTQIVEIELHENIYLDGAYTVGGFQGYTSLERISFYAKVSANSKQGFLYGCSNLKELHFYGTDLAIPSCLITSVPSANEVKIVFHEGSSGTLATGSETLPTVPNLGGRWTFIINENITPSNPSDPRLGCKWGSTTSTTGWNLILAVSDKSAYTPEQLEALKLSHGFCSRASSVAEATVQEATVKTYCELGYSEHTENSVYAYSNGYASKGSLTVGCTKGCGLVSTTELEPIITLLGYSSKIDSGEICVGYSLNREALALCEDKLDITLDYGVVAIIPTDDADYTPLYVENGEIKSSEYSITSSVTKTSASFDFVIKGFTKDYYDMELVMCAYVYDGSSIGYLCITQDENGNSEFKQCNRADTVTFSQMM